MIFIQYTYKGAAFKVLEEATASLSSADIFRQIIERQLVRVTESTSLQSLRSIINRDIKEHGTNSLFKRDSPDRFSLNWGSERTASFRSNIRQRYSNKNAIHRILAIKSSLIEDFGCFHGVSYDYERYLELLTPSRTSFILADHEETDSEYRKITSFVIIKHQNELLRCRQGASDESDEASEELYSIGFGGNVFEYDHTLLTFQDNDSGYAASLKNNILSETGIDVSDNSSHLETVGVLNDMANTFREHQFAFVHILEVSDRTLDSEHSELLRFVPISEISKQFHAYNYWSQLCLRTLFGEQLDFTCHTSVSPDSSLRQSARYVLAVGRIGSGKSHACKVLEEEFEYVRVPCSKILFELIGFDSTSHLTRERLQDLGLAFISQPNGHEQLARAIIDYMDKHKADRYVIDGLRYQGSLDALKNSLNQPIATLYIENTIERSFEFFTEREGTAYTFQQFLRILGHPVEQEIESFRHKSDVKISNHGSLESYIEELRKFFQQQLIENPWDVNAQRRHEQIIDRIDLTFWQVTTPAIINTLIEQDNHENFSVLDVGCGTGILTYMLSQHVKSVTGVDQSAESVRIAKKYTKDASNITIVTGPIEDFPVEEKCLYNLIVAHNSLHSIKNLDQALSKIYFLLDKNGWFVFTIPHPCHYPERRRALFDNYLYHKPSYHEIDFKISKDKNPLPRKSPYYHRMLSTYSTALDKAGFNAIIIEPQPDEESRLLYPSPTSYYSNILMMKCWKKSEKASYFTPNENPSM